MAQIADSTFVLGQMFSRNLLVQTTKSQCPDQALTSFDFPDNPDLVPVAKSQLEPAMWITFYHQNFGKAGITPNL